MKKSFLTKAVGMITSAALVISSMAVSMPAYANDSTPPATPPVTAYATAEQLTDPDVFTLHSENGTGVVKSIKFGNKSWLIAGKDKTTDPLAPTALVFLCSPNTPFSNSQFSTKNSEDWVSGNYLNYYQDSTVRNYLIGNALNGFKKGEKKLLIAPSVTTYNAATETNYTTEDKLYLPYGSVGSGYITVGTDGGVLNGGIKVSLNSVYSVCSSSKPIFWLRAPEDEFNSVYTATSDRGVTGEYCTYSYSQPVMPAMHLDMTNVLFASTANPWEVFNRVHYTSPSDDFTLRLDGSEVINSRVTVDGTSITLDLKEEAKSPTLIIQGNNNGQDWYYLRKLSPDYEPFDSETCLNSIRQSIPDLDLSLCNVWLEITYNSYDEANLLLTFAVNAERIDPPAPDPTPTPTPSPSPAQEDPFAYLKPLEKLFDDALAELEEKGTASTIYYAPEDKSINGLPKSIMQLLVNHPELSLDFTYEYEGITYNIYIGPGKAIDDDTQFFGPKNLFDHYKNAINPERTKLLASDSYVIQSGDTLNDIAKRIDISLDALLAANKAIISNPNMIYPNQAINVAGANNYSDLMIQAADAVNAAMQKTIAQNTIRPDAQILLTENISPRRDLSISEDGSLQMLSFNNLPKNQAGPAYAIVNNAKDKAYVLAGFLDANGTAVFTGFKLRPASTITICK